MSLEVLLVEDNPGDVVLLKESAGLANLDWSISVARDGNEALAFLRRQPPFENAPTPGLVLLDLNLPAKSGREVLQEVMPDPVLSRIPVVVLTSSTSEYEIILNLGLPANCYIIKPSGFEGYRQTIKLILDCLETTSHGACQPSRHAK